MQNHSPTASPSQPADSSVCIGNFDGCHLGHQALLAMGRAEAHHKDLQPTAVTFDRHPITVFQPDRGFLPLFTPEQKYASLQHFGIERVVILPFDAALRDMEAETFIERILLNDLRTKHLTVGYDFRFGKGRKGDATLLKQNADRQHFGLSIAEALLVEDTPISSSLIRRLISDAGDCEAATRLLGHPHAVVGQIRRGNQLGRTINFPTINVHESKQVLPAIGVYAGYVALDTAVHNLFDLPSQSIFPAVFNIGRRPTVEAAGAIKLESHILRASFGPDALYDKLCTCIFTHRLRDELKFPDLESLKTQIQRDVMIAERKLGI